MASATAQQITQCAIQEGLTSGIPFTACVTSAALSNSLSTIGSTATANPLFLLAIIPVGVIYLGVAGYDYFFRSNSGSTNH